MELILSLLRTMEFGKVPREFVFRFRHLLFVLTVLDLQFYLVNCSENSHLKIENCPEFPQPPKITILSDKEDFLAGDGRVITGQSLHLQCTASYPIYWDFIPSGSKFVMDSKVRSSCYNETLSIAHLSQYDRTGNYTCISGLDKNVATSAFLHIRDNDNLFHRKPPTHEYAESVDEEFWLIPCAATVKKLETVGLFEHTILKKVETTTQDSVDSTSIESDMYTEYEDDEYVTDGIPQQNENKVKTTNIGITPTTAELKNETEPQLNYTKYDSERGFLLKKSEFVRPHGLFKCRGSFGNTSDTVAIAMSNFNVYPMKKSVTYTNTNQMEILCESDEDITLDLSKAHNLSTISTYKTKSQSFKYSLKVLLQENNNPLHVMGYLRYQYVNKSNGVISCITVNSSKILHSWNHDFTKIVTCSLREYSGDVIVGKVSVLNAAYYDGIDDYISGSCQNLRRSVLFCHYGEMVTPAKNLAQQRAHGAWSLVRRDFTYFSTFGRYDSKMYTTTMIECLNIVDQDSTIINMVATASGFEVNPLQLDEKKNLVVYQRKNEIIEYLVGDTMPIWCVAAKSIFSDSIQWTINYKNGTSEAMEGEIHDHDPDSDYSHSYKIPFQWAYVAKIGIKLNEHLYSISCSAVVWNSTTVITANYTVELNQTTLNKAPYQVRARNTQTCDTTSGSPMIVMSRKLERWPSNDVDTRLVDHIVTDMNVQFSDDEADFFCFAEYPTEWTFQGDESESDLVRVDISDGNNSSTGGISPCFKNTVAPSEFYTSGEYICRKKNDHSVFSSVYLYAKADDGSIRLVNAGNHIDVIVDVNEPSTILPCRVTDPDASVEIYYHDGPGAYRKLSNAEFESYDPRKGFYMKTASLNKSAVYICSLQNSTNPQTSVSISIKIMKSTKVKEELKTQDFMLVSKLDDTRTEFSSLLITIVVVLILIIGLLIWLIKGQHQNNMKTSRALGSYFQLNNSPD